MIVVIANTKGGVGKSTLAVHLAGWLHRHGKSVVLADCDPQRSSSDWVGDAVPGVTRVPLPGANEILNQLPRLAEGTEFVVADGPGSNSEVSRALLLRADVAIVPCKASMLEVRALASATEVLRQAQDIRGGLPEAHIVLSMVGSRHRLTRDMKEAAAALELPLAPVPVVLRQAYADAPGQKALVWELGSRGREAANELDALFGHLLPSVRKPAKPKPRGPMSKRRSLVDGVKPRKPSDPEKEAAFVFGGGEGRMPTNSATPGQDAKGEPSRLPLTTRLRADLVKGLKRAALERQLDAVEPNTVQEILEEALEPWLRTHGYVK